MRTVWHKDSSQEASVKIHSWASVQRECLCSCMHRPLWRSRKVTSPIRDVYPRCYHPSSFSLGSKTKQKESRRRWCQSGPNSSLPIQTLRARTSPGDQRKSSWSTENEVEILNLTGLGLFKYKNKQATKGAAWDISGEGKGSSHVEQGRECLKRVTGEEIFLSCSMNWSHIGTMEIIIVSDYTSQHNCLCHSFISWKYICCATISNFEFLLSVPHITHLANELILPNNF